MSVATVILLGITLVFLLGVALGAVTAIHGFKEGLRDAESEEP